MWTELFRLRDCECIKVRRQERQALSSIVREPGQPEWARLPACLESLALRLDHVNEFIQWARNWFPVEKPSVCCETVLGRGHRGQRGHREQKQKQM